MEAATIVARPVFFSWDIAPENFVFQTLKD